MAARLLVKQQVGGAGVLLAFRRHGRLFRLQVSLVSVGLNRPLRGVGMRHVKGVRGERTAHDGVDRGAAGVRNGARVDTSRA